MEKCRRRKGVAPRAFAGCIAIAFLAGFSASCSAERITAAEYPANGTWTLAFEDDFSGDALDAASWTAIERGGNWNGENQAYTPANATVANGFLTLVSKKETWTGPVNCPGHPDSALGTVTREYTSAQVQTKGKRSWLYGRFECRARLSVTKGALDAIWMCPEDGGWPPEIDIAEVLGASESTLYMTNHYGSPQDHSMNSGVHQAPESLAEGYHTYAVEWEPGSIRWYLDGDLKYSASAGVPAKPFYFIICPAIGPEWTGDPDASSVFPFELSVDWVRVWQRDGSRVQ